ncbi:hypothetical protein M271_19355 [Streptomyces rapamycinicus NRRL 5491]|nr:hypothetical protein M271_19355 [Streptomyces rapamycinicus NRRL 5491]
MTNRSQAGMTPRTATKMTMASRVSNQRDRGVGSVGGVVGMEMPAIRPHPAVFQNAQSR